MNRKSLKLFLLLLLSPLFVFSQSLTGLWTGVMTNDSVAIRKDQSFEIALTEYKGKVYGYSRSEFIINDVLYYILKRVKGTIDGNTCEVKDDEIISFNFPGKLEKGVKVISTFYRTGKDSAWILDGKWKTTKTKNFYSLTGNVALKEEKDFSASKIFPHLEELNLSKDVAFYNDRKKETTEVVMKTAVPDNILYTSSIKTEEQSVIKKSITVQPDTKNVAVNTVAVAPAHIISNTTVPVKTTSLGVPVKTEMSITKAAPAPEIEKQKTSIKNQEPAAAKDAVVTITKPVTKTIAVKTATIESEHLIIKPVADPVALTAIVAGRKSEFSEMVNFKSDSLELSLYDNGEIDGDTVSIYLNGTILLARQGLKASAIKKTIYISPETQELSLVLFADNLGKYPPNTGLLVVHDGDDVYNIRFSADLQKNAGIVFKRKK